MKNWTVADIPSQKNRLAIVTGATGGIGFEMAFGLALAGAEVIVAGRSSEKGRDAVDRIIRARASARVRFEMLDLASLDSVRAFANRMLQQERPIDLLINNAGVMTPPKRTMTKDGFELQFGTNHLGHFALTAQLLPLLLSSTMPRVTNVASLAHRQGKIYFDDLQWEQRYKPWPAYGQSKLANMLFTFELQRLSERKRWNLMVNAAHPGFSRTDLMANGPGLDSLLVKFSRTVLMPLFSQSAAAGALPTLFAATSPDAKGAEYYGPKGFYEMKGPVAPAYIAPQAKDEWVAGKLWEVSEKLTGMQWPTGAQTRAAVFS
jgi:NAD(P)-dependent dehydrogenase (short-subunit alcohol dehydrogenase family)